MWMLVEKLIQIVRSWYRWFTNRILIFSLKFLYVGIFYGWLLERSDWVQDHRCLTDQILEFLYECLVEYRSFLVCAPDCAPMWGFSPRFYFQSFQICKYKEIFPKIPSKYVKIRGFYHKILQFRTFYLLFEGIFVPSSLITSF